MCVYICFYIKIHNMYLDPEIDSFNPLKSEIKFDSLDNVLYAFIGTIMQMWQALNHN